MFMSKMFLLWCKVLTLFDNLLVHICLVQIRDLHHECWLFQEGQWRTYRPIHSGIVEIHRHCFPHWITTVQASGSAWNMHTLQPFFLRNAPTLITYLWFIKVWNLQMFNKDKDRKAKQNKHKLGAKITPDHQIIKQNRVLSRHFSEVKAID